jgi:hypothetical protein
MRSSTKTFGVPSSPSITRWEWRWPCRVRPLRIGATRPTAAVDVLPALGARVLCLSPQCGFSSTVEGDKLTAEDQAAKLRLIVEMATEVWGGVQVGVWAGA